MTSASESPIASAAASVIGGVDTHKHTHYAAAIDTSGRLLGHREFPANDRGYVALLSWLRSHGEVVSIGVESTGSFGTTLARFLTAAAVQVVEVNRPDRAAAANTASRTASMPNRSPGQCSARPLPQPPRPSPGSSRSSAPCASPGPAR